MISPNPLDGKVCAIVDTPYQLLNCLNIVYHTKENASVEVDLFIVKSGIFTETTINRIRETKLFARIYSFREITDQEIKKNAISYNKDRLTRSLLPKKYVGNLCGKKRSALRCEYNYILCAFDTPIALAMSVAYADAQIVLFDEGTASYTNNISPITKNRDNVFRIRRRNNPWRNIEYIFVNNEKYYEGELAKKAVRIPSIKDSMDLQSIMYKVFGFKGSEIYDKGNFVYLEQPFAPGKQDNLNNTQMEIIKTIEQFVPDCIARRHPKQENCCETTLPIDTDNDMWELVSCKRLKDSHVIIGTFSTAQLTPKIIFDIEPTLIFTYGIYSNWITSEHAEAIEKLICKLKESYRDKNKIVNISTIDELERVFSNINYR